MIPIRVHADCKDALSKADRVITRQQLLIDALTKRHTEALDENARLERDIFRLSELAATSQEEVMVYGLGGVVLGIVAGLLITK
jgi:hypothetical protein